MFRVRSGRVLLLHRRYFTRWCDASPSRSMHNDVKGGPCNSRNRISVCPAILPAVGHAVAHVCPPAHVAAGVLRAGRQAGVRVELQRDAILDYD